MAKSTATLTDNETGKSYEMPIIHGTIGPRLVDVRKFYGDSGMFTYDPGFTSTGSCGSKITYIDGDEGVLLALAYSTQRGYGRTHPFAGEIRLGHVEVSFTPEELGFPVVIGEITVTECEMINQFKGSATVKPQFTRGYGLGFAGQG